MWKPLAFFFQSRHINMRMGVSVPKKLPFQINTITTRKNISFRLAFVVPPCQNFQWNICIFHLVQENITRTPNNTEPICFPISKYGAKGCAWIHSYQAICWSNHTFGIEINDMVLLQDIQIEFKAREAAKSIHALVEYPPTNPFVAHLHWIIGGGVNAG